MPYFYVWAHDDEPDFGIPNPTNPFSGFGCVYCILSNAHEQIWTMTTQSHTFFEEMLDKLLTQSGTQACKWTYDKYWVAKTRGFMFYL